MKVLFLTVSGSQGYGHLNRCLAISLSLEELGIETHFVLDSKNHLLKKKNFTIFSWYEDFNRVSKFIKKYENIFIDCLNIKKSVYLKIEKKSNNCFYIDDFKNWNLSNSTVFNWTIGKRSKKINYYFHEKYTSLRKAYYSQRKKKINEEINGVLIFFGSNDSKNITEQILLLLLKKIKSQKKYYVILNSNNFIEIKKKFKQYKNLKLFLNLSPKNFREVMVKCDLAISAGGQILYELANVGIPTISFILEKNQEEDVFGWAKKNFLLNLGYFQKNNFEKNLIKSIIKLNSKKIRTKMSSIGQNIIDGKGSDRIAKVIKERIQKNAIIH